MCKKKICLVVFTLVFMATVVHAAVKPITSVTITRQDNPDGTPNFWLESITVDDYTVPVLRLVTGLSEGVATAQPAPYNDITVADNFDLNLFAGRATEVPPTHKITEFGNLPTWSDTNGDNPDFFVFETGGNQDINIEAVLPGGAIGQSVTVPQDTWGNTGLNITTSGPHNGQTIEGVAFAITDLLDQNGNNLSNSSVIEGIQVTSDGYDPSCVCAISSGKILVAYNPTPADGSLYTDTWVTLSWLPGDTAASHDVYMGEGFNDVNDATNESSIFLGNQLTTLYVAGFPGFAYPDGLVAGTTYYWRIDEVETDGTTKHKGNVWSFSIPPKTAYDPNPADGDGIADTSVTLTWTAGIGAKLHTVYFGDDFDTVANATVGMPVGTASYNPGPLEPEKVYYWRIDEFDGYGTYQGDVWAFTTPGAVGNPQPANAAADVAIATILSWTAANNATSHEVYLGLDKNTVRGADTASPEYKGSKTLGAESYDPGLLEPETTYYWRVDEVYNGNPVKGPVWSFTVGRYLQVDDFESYTDDDAAGEAIWQTWIDGFGVADNGAQVGYLVPPYCEQTIVQSGAQSMPLLYNNEAGVSNSEGTLPLAAMRDWTTAGVAELSLWIRGDSANAAEPMYVAISNAAGAPGIVAREEATAAQSTSWKRWVIPLQTFADQGISLTNVDKIAVGLGSKSGMAAAGGSGTVYIDDIRLYRL